MGSFQNRRLISIPSQHHTSIMAEFSQLWVVVTIGILQGFSPTPLLFPKSNALESEP